MQVSVNKMERDLALTPRTDFPLLARTLRSGKPLVYLDSAATSQKPQCVLDAVHEYNVLNNGAVNRGAHELSEDATTVYEDARKQVAEFVGVETTEIIWTKNSTESLNLLAYAFGNATAGRGEADAQYDFSLKPGDNVVVTRAEHHSNLVPWQELCLRTGAEFRWLDLKADGGIDLVSASVIDERTKVVAFNHVSNVTGIISPVADLVALARKNNAYTVLDACQSVPHMPIDFHKLDVDFAVFSGHKLYAPLGVGVLYAKQKYLSSLPPFLFGGSMVEIVTMEATTYASAPAKFEAGTQSVADIVGLAAATEYLQKFGMDKVEAYEKQLLLYLMQKMHEVPGVQILGPQTATNKVAVVAFTVDGVHPHDVGQVLDSYGVATRVGHHCAQPVHRHFNVFASNRVSLAPYNTIADVDAFICALAQVRKYFGLEGA